jgi:hypothetical protein
MAATPDLPPGARQRAWIMLTLTTVGGAAMYFTFGRAETLWIAGIALAILVYLLIGVELALRADRRELGPIVAACIETLGSDYAMILDSNGTVLNLSVQGGRTLGHPPEILQGQNIVGLLPEDDVSNRSRFRELLRFGSLAHAWSGTLALLDEQGGPRVHSMRSMELTDPRARRLGLIALTTN